MDNTATILVSNIALPSSAIGSWTTRITRLINSRPNLFTYIFSPSHTSEDNHSKKRKFITWYRPLRSIQLKNWVARDYLKSIKRVAKDHDRLVIVIMDDPHLLEAVALYKHTFAAEIEVIFSFHGYNLTIAPKILGKVDKILWLSETAIKKSQLSYENALPNSIVVGNAVDSDVFFPLNEGSFSKLRDDYGYSAEDEILIWMANDRPKKGFHIFESIVKELVLEFDDLKVITIGTTKSIDHPNVKNVGRIPNNEVAAYLQLGNYYMFTTLYEEGFGLSMIEAYKCGNVVLASKLGAIPEVLNMLQRTYVIESPEQIEDWVNAFKLGRQNTQNGKLRMTREEANDVWNYKNWEQRFINAITVNE